MYKCGSVLLVCAAIATTAGAQTGTKPHIQAIRFWSFGDVTRVAVQTQGPYTLSFDQVEKPARVFFDLTGLRPQSSSHVGLQRSMINDQRVKEMRVAQVSAGRTRIVFDLRGPAEVSWSRLVNPDRLVIEIRPKGTSIAALSVRHAVAPPARVDSTAASDWGKTTAATSAPPVVTPPPAKAPVIAPLIAKTVPPAPTPLPSDSITLPQTPPVLVPPPSNSPSLNTASPAKTDSAGERSLVRIFGLKMGKVVIDAGHGGHDTGTIGPNGLLEKDLVLDVALRLGKLLNQRLGATVVYTRADDTFIPLEQRTKIANQEKADLFISIHANSSPEPSATGVETYFFNLTSDRSGLDLATRENAASASSISDLNDLLHKAVLQTKKEESREFAQQVQEALWTESLKMNSKSRDRGVRQAPFVVLIGAGMPSILAEVGFVSNPHDEKLMKKNDERQKIAEALFKGVSQYANSLSHVQVAKTE